MNPSPDDVRAALERILASEPFINAGRLSRLLRYIVERTLAGEGSQLKEYVVGVEVFDRSESYDQRIDSIVRVEARRLRAKLDEYYSGAGQNDPVVISVPRGSYLAVFGRGDAAIPGPISDQPAAITGSQPVTNRSWLGVAGLVAAILIVALVAATSSRPATPAVVAAPPAPSVAVLPFEYFSTSADDALLVSRIADGVTTDLARLGKVSVASRTSASHHGATTRPVREVAQALGVQFVMEASATVGPTSVRVSARLVDANFDRKVWVGQFEGSPDRIPELTRQIANDASAALVNFSSHP